MKKVLLAGVTGYLGSYIAQELHKKDYHVRAIARNPEKLKQRKIEVNEILKAEVTQFESLTDCCKGIDVVISTVGITKQKDGLSYMDVDYQANMNLLKQAKQSGVKKFIYVSVLNGKKIKNLKICEAKEMFVDQLEKSGLDYCIVRPNGFFSDMSDIYNMAKSGRVYLFGDGELKGNPIHGEDLAEVCVAAIEKFEPEINVGGPETLTQNELAMTAFKALGKKHKITHLPDWIRVFILKMVKIFTGSKVYGPIEFIFTVMSIDMLAPEDGKHTLEEYFTRLSETEE